MVQDLTKGKLTPLIIRFTIPLVLGNLLQLTYNAIDSIIVGRFVGSKALAAVGTANPITTLIILLLNGITLGAGILIGNLYGAQDYKRLERQISTAMIAGSLFSITVSLFGILFAKDLLLLLQVKSAVLNMATGYLRIILAGLIFTFVYNYFASALRALGDSQSPLYFLAASAIFNIIGDLFFIIVLKQGVHGAAISTVISEGLSVLLCLIYIKKKVPILDLKKKWLVFDPKMLKKTITYGFVTALQQSTVQIGKLGIQSIVNTMGVSEMAAFNVVNRPDDFAIIPEQNIAHAMTAVMAQNKGAGKNDRLEASFYIGLRIELIYGIVAGLIFLIFANPIMRIFTTDHEVIALGEIYLHLIAFMYILPGITNGLQGYFRGTGDLKITFISSLLNMTMRVISCAYFTFSLKLGFQSVPWSYLVGWIFMLAFETPYLISYRKKHNA
jgi:putative MATE family efflux protein